MAILEEEVCIGMGRANASYYESLGYEVPKHKTKHGIQVKRGTKIYVKVEDLTPSCNVKLTKICDDCGEQTRNQTYNIIMSLRKKGDGLDRCKKCGSEVRGIIQKNNVKYEKSLEYCAVVDNKEYLLKEFCEENSRKPHEVSYKSNDSFLWKCTKCKGKYQSKLSNRANGRNCPYCKGNKALRGYNDLWTTHSEIAKLLLIEERGFEITAGHNGKEIFKCLHCGYHQEKLVYNLIRQGFSCSNCSDGLSYPEKFVIEFLKQLDVNFEREKEFLWSDRKVYDFYIAPDIIIETHGRQHYVDTGFGKLNGKTLEDEIKNDNHKFSLAVKNGITKYIILDCRESNLENVKNSIQHSLLAEIFNLSKVNWKQCNEFASNSSMLRLSCDYWKQGVKNALEISNIIGLTRNTVIKYLKRGTEIGWCDYDPKEQMKLIGSQHGGKNSKKVIQLSKNNDYIKTWNSITQVSEELGISVAFISAVCNKKSKSAKGFIWMFEDDYNLNKGSLMLYKKLTNAKKIVKLTLNGEFIKEYSSITAAKKELGVNNSGINLVCKGERKTSSGFKWMYKEDYEKIMEENANNV